VVGLEDCCWWEQKTVLLQCADAFRIGSPTHLPQNLAYVQVSHS
jgi:hypothetical protein